MEPTLRTAVHECGHAVMVYLHRGTIDHVSALPDDEFGGRVKWRHGNRSCDACDPFAAALIALGGVAAEAPYLGVAERRDALSEARGDAEQVDCAIGEMAHSPLEAALLAAWLRIRSREIVATPKFACLMQTLLPLLLEHGQLDGDTATAELERASALFDRTTADHRDRELVPATERHTA